MALCLGSVGAARADGIDIKVKGQWDFSFGWVVNNSFKDSVNRSRTLNGTRGGNRDSFQARQRVRTQINFITSEYLQGVLMFEIGDLDWGANWSDSGNSRSARHTGGSLDADGVNIETKRAYLDWIIPYTEVSVRMGIQGLTLPSTPMGSPLFDADVAGIVVSSPITDWLSVTALWIRPFDAYNNGPSNSDFSHSVSDEVDAFGILLPMTFADYGVNFTPWFIYSFVGANSGLYDYVFGNGNTGDNSVGAINPWGGKGGSTHAYWVGGHLEFSMFDPLVFNLEAIYGHLGKTELTGFAGTVNNAWSLNGYDKEIGASGWFIAATLDYKLDFMTPGIFGWWASGDKDSAARDGKLGRMPVLGNDGGSFGPTSFGSAGYYGIAQYSNNGSIMGTGTGTWGIGIQLADISFIEDLKHTLRFAYYRGTNDSELVERGDPYLMYAADRLYLTTDDSVFEINFDHQYKIYENLTAVLELGWLHLSSDEETWRRYHGRTGNGFDAHKENDNSWKAQISLRYSF